MAFPKKLRTGIFPLLNRILWRNNYCTSSNPQPQPKEAKEKEIKDKDKDKALKTTGKNELMQKVKSVVDAELQEPPLVEQERHKYWKSKSDRAVNKALIRTDFFEQIEDKSKQNFITTLEMFPERDVHSRGHVEFIYAALSQMKAFGVHRDLDTYKQIINIFPKGKMIQTNMFQVEFMHYPKQQQCGVDILEQMEHYGVCPDSEVQLQLTNVFGSQSFPMRKASRMLYWMPKFKNISPWRVPDPLPEDSLELAKLAIERITSIDLSTKITVFNTEELPDALDQTWIVSGQSEEQQKLIEQHDSKNPIYVEGAFRVYIQRTCINYFVLRAEPKRKPKQEGDSDDVTKISTIFQEEHNTTALENLLTVHEQEDGIILGVCATGNSSRDSVLSWIRFLEASNPRLGRDISVLFTLKSPLGPTDDLEITSVHQAEKRLSSEDFSVGSGGKFGIDPFIPNLKQVGIWSQSETKFANWPHHHHSPDSENFKQLQENYKFVEEKKHSQINVKDNQAREQVTDSESNSKKDELDDKDKDRKL